MTPCSVGVHVEDRADRRLELGVHQDDVLAVRERLERDPCAELDVAGHLADHVDVLAPAEEERVVGHGRAAAACRVLELRLRADRRRARGPRSGRPRPRGPGFRFEIADDAHPRDAVDDLVREPLAHEAGADDADADRAALGLAGLRARCRR